MIHTDGGLKHIVFSLCAQVRTLETIIRLSSAAAKVRLSGAVEVQDVEVARGLVSHVLQADKSPE